MKIFVDENIPLITVRELQAMGHDVKDIRETPTQGISDDELWAMVKRENRHLITTDKGFSQYRNEAHSGILIIRLKQPNYLKIHKRQARYEGYNQVHRETMVWTHGCDERFCPKYMEVS
jgi:predicted nuclease of predicted toxin-antitoxin system